MVRKQPLSQLGLAERQRDELYSTITCGVRGPHSVGLQVTLG